MASIYEKDIAGIRKELIKFGKTAYGKTIFFIAYFIPISLFFALIILAIVGFCSNYSEFDLLKSDFSGWGWMGIFREAMNFFGTLYNPWERLRRYYTDY